MRKPPLLLLFISLLFVGNKAAAQLSGVYTIGGISPNYTTLNAALNDLGIQGVSGPVVFNMRPGTYIDSAEAFNFAGSSPVNTVTLQSENLDSASVTITVPRNWNTFFNYINRAYVNMNELSFYENDSNSYAIWMQNLNISNCVIYAPYTNGIMIDYGIASIKNSVITCGIGISYIFSTPTVISGNIINGPLSFGYDTSLVFRHNVVYNNSYLLQFLYGYWDTIEYNQFYGQLQLAYAEEPPIIRFNTFSYPADSGTALSIGFTDNQKIINNTFYGNVIINNGGYYGPTMFAGNKIYAGMCSLLSAYHSIISNNYVEDSLFVEGSDTSEIVNNNFSSSGYLNLQSQLCTVNNNNFSRGVVSYYSDNIIQHNNYYPVASLYDTNQTNYNPQYLNASNIHTENPHLIGKGVYLPNVKYDIDSIVRNNPPTIGANELCIPANDTIDLACGDSVNLFMCGAPVSGNFHWSPAGGLNNASIATPSASPSLSTMYHVIESISGFHDSVYIKIVPYKVQAFEDTLIYYGDTAPLLASYNAGATYQWLPVAHLSNPNAYRTQASPLTTTVYTVTATVPGCGTSVDSVKVTVGCHNIFVQPICTATLDTATNKYEVLWGRTNSPPAGGYGYFNIYKDTGAGYALIHSQPLDSLSEYMDTSSNPSLGSATYEISTVDSCGESALSAPHTTIYLTTTAGVNAYNLNWTAYVGFTPTEYRIFRGPRLNALTQIDSVPNSVLTYIDSFPPVGSYYAIEAVSPNGICIPTTHRANNRLAASGSFSNGFNTGTLLGVQHINTALSKLNVYPNPGNGQFTLVIANPPGRTNTIEVYNVFGEKVYSQLSTFNSPLSINLSNQPNGVYLYRVSTETGELVGQGKLVIQR